MPAEIIQFEEFELDLARYELRRGDRVVKLEKNPMELLILLVEKRGRLVTREEIIQRIWGDNVFIDTRHSINTAIHKLRNALRDDPESPRILETVVGKGYRLVAITRAKSAEQLLPNAAAAVSAPLDTEQRTPQGLLDASTRQRFLIRLGIIGIVLTSSAAIAFWLTPHNLRNRVLGRQTRIDSLAVLPFENLSGDPSQDYFADGFTDELTTDLAEQTQVRVVSRTSVMRYKGSKKPLPEIASELHVDAIVEGSVVLTDQQVRITAQLIQASNDQHLWAHSYDRDRKDLLAIQNEVAATIAGLIHARTDSQNRGAATFRATSRGTGYTPETYELSLECRSIGLGFTDEGVHQKIRCYQHIIDRDPNCAPAYASMAYNYLLLGQDNTLKAREVALKAVELDLFNAEAHLVLAHTKLQIDRDLPGAEQEFHRALSLNPSFGSAHAFYSLMLVGAGRMEEAIAEARRSQDLDPFSGGIHAGVILFMAHQYDQTIETEKAALQFYPQSERAILTLGSAYELKKMYKEAAAQYEKRVEQDDHGVFLAAMGRIFVLTGNLAKAAEVKEKIEHYPATESMWPYDAALFYATLGDRDSAFRWLNEDLKQHDDWLVCLNVDPRLSSLRSDPRFRDIVKKAGLPVAADH